MTTTGRSAYVKARSTVGPGAQVGSSATTGRSEVARASGTNAPGTQVGSAATVGRSQVVRIPGGAPSVRFDRTVWGGPSYTTEEQYVGDPLPFSAPFPLGPNVWTSYRATFAPALTPAESTLDGWLNGTYPQPGGQGVHEFPIWWDEPYTMLAEPVVGETRLRDVEMFVVTGYEGGDKSAAWSTMRGQDGRTRGTYPTYGLSVIICDPLTYGQSIDGAVAFVVPDTGDPDGREWVTGATTDGYYAHVAHVAPAFATTQDVEWTIGLWRIGEA